MEYINEIYDIYIYIMEYMIEYMIEYVMEYMESCNGIHGIM